MQYVGTGRQSTVQNIDFTAASTAIGNAFGTGTWKVRLACTQDCYFLIGDGVQSVSASNGSLLAAGAVEYFTVTPGQRMSAIRVSADGRLNVTEIT